MAPFLWFDGDAVPLLPLLQANGRRLLETLSASDLKACAEDTVLQAVHSLTVAQFLSVLRLAERERMPPAFAFAKHCPAVGGIGGFGGEPAVQGRHLESHGAGDVKQAAEPAVRAKQVTCTESSWVGDVAKQALMEGVHHVWVVERPEGEGEGGGDGEGGVLCGVVAFTDVLSSFLQQ